MDDHFEKYYFKAVHFLKFRQRSVKEMRDHLKKKNAPDDVIERVIKMLSDQRFLNDLEFAKAWIENRARLRPKGRRIVELELKQKGISKDIIEEAFSSESSEDVPDEKGQLDTLVSERMPKYSHLNRFEIYQKLGAYLARKGFDWDDIKRSIDACLEKSYN